MPFYVFFFFNDTATTEIYTLSLHDALPIYASLTEIAWADFSPSNHRGTCPLATSIWEMKHTDSETSWRWICRTCQTLRSEEHTSELQSRQYLVCRLLLEKKRHDNGSGKAGK